MASAKTAAGNQPNQLIPFRLGTRQRMQQFGTVSFTQANFGSQFSTELPRVGFLAGIIVNVSGTLNLGAAGVFGPYGVFNLIKRVKLNLNTGAANIWDTSGFGAMQFQGSLRDGFNPLTNDLAFSSTNNGNNPFYYSFYIPVALNDSLQFSLGQINLQAPEVRATCELTLVGSGAEWVSQFNTVSGTINLTYVYYEVPNPRTVMFPPLALHRVLEERQQITATGDQIYTVPRGGSILELMHIVTLNNVVVDLRQGQPSSNQIDSVRLVLNKTDTVYNVPSRAFAFWSALKTTGPLFGTSIRHNFLDGGSVGVGEGDFRDTFDSEAISVMESIITVNSGAVIGANAWVDTIRRIFQPLAA